MGFKPFDIIIYSVFIPSSSSSLMAETLTKFVVVVYFIDLNSYEEKSDYANRVSRKKNCEEEEVKERRIKRIDEEKKP